MNPVPIRSLIFDFGGVLGYFHHRLTARKLAAYSPLSEEEIVGYLYPVELEDAYEKGLVTTDQMVEALRRDLKLRCDDAVIRVAMADIFSPNTELCDMIPRWQSRYRLVLGSNTNEMHFQHYRRQFATMLDCFHGLIVSHEIGVRKPDRVFFEHCVRLAGTRAEECVFVDDMHANIVGARAAGLHGVQYRDFPTLIADLQRLGVELPGAGG